MTQASGGLSALTSGRSILVCCGPGGVGKTTTAAALALEGARLGRRAVVVTIDPARRLANALGLASLTNVPRRIDHEVPGELWALMLDTKSTFDELVLKYARSREQADRILSNAFYRNISGALSGTQEYMAMEKLFELHDSGRFELIVVDTPPTRNALDFIDAPRRITRFLDNPVFRLLMAPTRAYVKAVNLAAQAFLRAVSRVVGGEVVRDAVAFFTAFEGMEDGFRQRAAQVLRLLSQPDTAFVLVTSPRRDALEEAAYFADRLDDAGLPVEAVVANRVHPRFGTRDGVGAAEVRRRAGGLAGTALGAHYANLADFRALAEREEEHLGGLVGRARPAPVVRVPFLAHDVHDFEGLAELGRHLFGRGLV